MVGTGDLQELNPHRQQYARTRLDEAESYARASETHMWLVILTHKGTDAMLDAFDSPDPAAMPILDVDTMMGSPAIACFVCEAIYEPRLRRRKCPGDPKH